MKKNILVLIEYFGQGGAERVGAMLAQMLYESGKYNVWLYAIHATNDLPQSNGVKIGSLNIGPDKSLFSKLNNYALKISRLNKLKKQLNIDLSISSLWPVDWINAFTGNDKKIAIIQINILNNVQNEKMVKYRRLVSSVYSRFDKVVLGGGNLVQEMTGFFKLDRNSLQVIQNPVETKRIEKNLQVELTRPLKEVFDKYKVFVAANRLNPIKNTEALVYIYKLLHDKENVKFLIIGEGEEKEKLQRLIINEGLSYSQIEDEAFNEKSNFYFLNFQNNIHNIIGNSNGFLFPTKAEGLPLTLLEAMYAGAPVIVSDCPNGGIGEIMKEEYSFDINNERESPELTDGGYLMPIPAVHNQNRMVLWKDKIEEVLSADRQTIDGYISSNKVKAAKFDIEKVKETWVKLTEEVLQK